MIELNRQGRRWTVTLNRAEKANALSLAMLTRLHEVFSQAAQDRELRVLVVTGAGRRVFSAGADLGEARDATAITTHPIWERTSSRLANLPCLTIAALNGTVAGGGFGLALACDLRLAVPEARFFYPVLKNGFLPQPSDVRRLRALIGPAHCKTILLGGQKLSADQALAVGLIERIVPRTEMADTIDAFSEAALNADPAVLVAIKRMIQSDRLSAELHADCVAAVHDRDPAALARLLPPQGDADTGTRGTGKQSTGRG